MTICIYSQGVLYADRAGVGRSNVPQFVEMKKLFASSCGHFVLAISGSEVNPKEGIFKTCIRGLGKSVKAADALSERFDVTGASIEYLYDRSVMLMTARNVYSMICGFENKKPTVYFTPLDKSLNGFIGSGCMYASIAMQAGKTPLEAIRIASLADTQSYLTAVDQIAMKDLIPF